MTANTPTDVPDLAQRGRGETLWLDGGVARPASEAKEAAAA